MDRESALKDQEEAQRPVSSVGESVTLRVFRGDAEGGEERDYDVPTFPGMVVLDAVHHIQANQSQDIVTPHHRHH